ncbi:MAG: 5-formyltetrahydrofolate cyclo-ligase [Qingshengfaniella sp.]
MTEIPAEKAAVRAAARQRRADAVGQADVGAALRHLSEALAPFRGQPVAGYMAMQGEIDPLPLMTDLAAAGPVCVPVIEGRDRPLRFRAWQPGAALVKGTFGALIPETGDWIVPRALIVPLLSFDRAGYRLGYGGGFYDRTLENLRALGGGFAVGFAFGAQELPAVPIEPTDQRLDAIATEKGLWRFDR